MSNIQKAYEDVTKFNHMAGNLGKVGMNSIEAQLSFITEELDETWKALEEGNNVELLDGACDLFVTVAGLLQKLDRMGYDIGKALALVNENNLSKFPLVSDYPVDDVGAITPKDVRTEIRYSRWVFKRISNGKVMKPTNFKAVDISACVPLKGI